MKKRIAFILAFIMAVSMAACHPQDDARNPSDKPGNVETNTGTENQTDANTETQKAEPSQEATVTEETTVTLESGEVVYPCELPMTFEIRANGENPEISPLKAGTMRYVLKKVWIVEDQSGIPAEGGFIPHNVAWVAEDMEHGKGWTYPELVQEDGSFAEDIFLLMMEIEVENVGAECWTVDDLNSEKKSMGVFKDPYLFTDLGGRFTVRERAGVNGTQPFMWETAYYSGYGALKDDPENEMNRRPFAYRLKPGEKQTFTVGTFIGNCLDGTPRTFSSLCLRIAAEWEGNKDDEVTLVALPMQ